MTTEKKSVSRLVNIQHERNEETEFYPSTQEIVDSVARWISRNGEITSSILDIGCGNGGFFEKLAYALPFVHAAEMEKALFSGNFELVSEHIVYIIIYSIIITAVAVFCFLRQMKKQ